MRTTTTVVMVITTASMMVSMMSMAMIIIVDVAVATVGVEMHEADVTRPASSCAASEGGGGRRACRLCWLLRRLPRRWRLQWNRPYYWDDPTTTQFFAVIQYINV